MNDAERSIARALAHLGSDRGKLREADPRIDGGPETRAAAAHLHDREPDSAGVDPGHKAGGRGAHLPHDRRRSKVLARPLEEIARAAKASHHAGEALGGAPARQCGFDPALPLGLVGHQTTKLQQSAAERLYDRIDPSLSGSA